MLDALFRLLFVFNGVLIGIGYAFTGMAFYEDKRLNKQIIEKIKDEVRQATGFSWAKNSAIVMVFWPALVLQDLSLFINSFYKQK